MQINPDHEQYVGLMPEQLKFQSYQFMQINPDHAERLKKIGYKIVSIVSIHADQSRRDEKGMESCGVFKFQSYQFMQINPDVHYC